MRNVWTIAKREYDHYFNSPAAYAIAFMILLVEGIIFVAIIQNYIANAFQSFGSAPDVTPITGNFVFLMVFAIPALTMRLVSDETRTGTMELLLTAPVRDWELILGKWLGGYLFILTVLGITLVYPIILNGLVTPGLDQRHMMSAYLGVMMVAAAFMGIGVGISAIFTNQVAALFFTMGTFIFLWWLIGFPASFAPTGSEVFRYLDMKTHFYDTMNQGVINVSDIVYYVSLTVLGLFIGTTAVEMRRWR